MESNNVGILGGGQLARMLALSAHPMGLKVHALCESANDPAAQVVQHVTLGNLTDPKILKDFSARCSTLTFESEFVDIPLLKSCLSPKTHIFPSLESIELLQDRCSQKETLDRYRVKTSPWVNVSTLQDLSKASELFDGNFVLKQRRFGYDGYGTYVVKNGKFDPAVLKKSQYGFIAEKFIPFQRELAFSIVRSRSGKVVYLPLVESVQIQSRCFSVRGPIKHKGLNLLRRNLTKLMQELDYIGILAAELFDQRGELTVNELAPRVHNSAHYSQDALSCSQFEYHWRAGLDLPLPPVVLRAKGFAMVNLLGEGGQQLHLSRSLEGHLHWYGKSENRKGRKMGHINVISTSSKDALKRALQWRKEFDL